MEKPLLECLFEQNHIDYGMVYRPGYAIESARVANYSRSQIVWVTYVTTQFLAHALQTPLFIM